MSSLLKVLHVQNKHCLKYADNLLHEKILHYHLGSMNDLVELFGFSSVPDAAQGDRIIPQSDRLRNSSV
jgi:hypothetical protein